MEHIATSDILLGVSQSILGNCWRQRAQDERMAAMITQRLGVHEVVGRVLSGRGVDAESAEYFLAPTLKHFLPDPSHLLDMDAASERLAAAVIAGETIAVWGDYDVDGATSSALLKRYFALLGADALVYIPDRISEGYGPNTAGMLSLKTRGASVVVTVDCGTLAFEPLAAARAAGLDVIVADHHTGDARLPEALAVINPNRLDETSEHRQLAAVGVCFLLAIAVNRTLRKAGFFATRNEPDLLSLLDLVALGTVCDVVPLVGLNRAFVAQGLKVMAGRGNTGLRALMDITGMNSKPAAYHAGFVLGPRINAGGRVGAADLGTRLLSTQDEAEAFAIAQQLEQFNAERKAIEAMVLEQAMVQAESQEEHPVIVVASEGWHPGVIGIVAGRIKERFQRPVAVIALDHGIGKASARSVSGVDFGSAVIAAKNEGLLLAGGGHAMAAGFTVEQPRLDALREFLISRMGDAIAIHGRTRSLWLDGVVNVTGITTALARTLEQIGPCGAGNPNVRLALPNVRVLRADRVGENHLRLLLADGSTDEKHTPLKAMAFRIADEELGQRLASRAGRFHIAGQIQLNSWQGNENAEFFIDDAAFSA